MGKFKELMIDQDELISRIKAVTMSSFKVTVSAGIESSIEKEYVLVAVNTAHAESMALILYRNEMRIQDGTFVRIVKTVARNV